MGEPILFILGGIVLVVFIVNMINSNDKILVLKRDLQKQRSDLWVIIHFLREILPNEKWLPAAKKEVLDDIKKDLFRSRHGLISLDEEKEKTIKRILDNISKFDGHLIGYLQVGDIRDRILRDEFDRREEILGGDRSVGSKKE